MNQTQLLQIYGLARFVFGIGQLVALAAGFFLNEFIINPPADVITNVLDENLVALVYLAILGRCFFHITVGVGIARLKQWAGTLLIWGWIVMVFVTFGLGYSLYEQWSQESGVQSFMDIIALPQTLLYFAWIAFDIIFIRQAINKVNPSDEEIGLNYKIIWITLGLAVVFFVLIMFLGQPIKQGFHKGFYKSRGEKSEEKVKIFKEEFAAKEDSSMDEELPQMRGAAPTPTESAPLLIQRKENILTEIPQTVAQEAAEALESMPKIEEGEINQGLPYATLLGFVGGLAIMVALLSLVYSLYVYGALGHIQGFSFSLLLFGFILWTIYGVLVNLMPVTLTSLLSALLSLALVFGPKRN